MTRKTRNNNQRQKNLYSKRERTLFLALCVCEWKNHQPTKKKVKKKDRVCPQFSLFFSMYFFPFLSFARLQDPLYRLGFPSSAKFRGSYIQTSPFPKLRYSRPMYECKPWSRRNFGVGEWSVCRALYKFCGGGVVHVRRLIAPPSMLSVGDKETGWS